MKGIQFDIDKDGEASIRSADDEVDECVAGVKCIHLDHGACKISKAESIAEMKKCPIGNWISIYITTSYLHINQDKIQDDQCYVCWGFNFFEHPVHKTKICNTCHAARELYESTLDKSNQKVGVNYTGRPTKRSKRAVQPKN